MGLRLAFVILLATWGSGKKKALRPQSPPEAKDDQKKRKREDLERQRRRSNLAKFLS